MSSKNVHLPNVPEAVSDPTNMIYDHHLSKQASTIGPRTQMPVCSLCLKSELRLDIAAAVIFPPARSIQRLGYSTFRFGSGA